MTISKILREKQLKVTPQRRAVYGVLETLRHASVEEIAAAVTALHPQITVSTVYNVLDCFAEKAVIARLSTTKGKLYYDITPVEHHHIITDHEIADYHNEELSRLINAYITQHPLSGYDIERVSLQIYAQKQTQR